MNTPPVSKAKALVALALAFSFLIACSSASATATPEQTATPVPTASPSPTNMPMPNSTLQSSTTTTPQVFCVECPYTESVAVEAWVDQNVNGTREPEEPPLEGVRFRGEYCVVSCGTTCVENKFAGAMSDADGYAEIWMDGCCGDVVISPEVPPRYRLTTSDHCCSYGFVLLDTRTPIATPTSQPTPTPSP